MAIDPWNLILEWWSSFQPDPRADANNIESGLKKQQIPASNIPEHVDPAVKGSLQTAACQYWVKNLPEVCTHWDSENMVCGYDTSKGEIPTGHALGGCDGLGRRQWCNRYTLQTDENGSPIPQEPNKYICVLPSIEKCGTGKIVRHEQGIQIIPWTPEEISGYNPDENNVGQCDGNGLGRGSAGLEQEFIENLQLLPQICKHYKPHQMGFGAVDPRPFHGDPPSKIWKTGQTYIPRTPKELHDGSAADPLVLMGKRLPFSFQVYNLRAKFQKCAHWDADYGAVFGFNDYGADPSNFQINVDQKATEHCKLYSSCVLVQPFCDLEDEVENIPWVLQNIWNKHGSVVCNGAKPECPCYTGRWIYCTDRNMQDGMRVSADQIFELRFWTSDWSSQEEYDSYYAAKPGTTREGFADVTTSDIFTFTQWIQDDPNNIKSADDSRMKGKQHHMCMPAPPHMREYDPDDYCTITPVTYPKPDEYLGIGSSSEPSYPTLVRELESPTNIYPNLSVVYPYNSPNPWQIVPCEKNDQENYCYHNNNLMYGNPTISVIGQCIRNRQIWAINTSHPEIGSSSFGAPGIMKNYARAQLIPDNKYEEFCRSTEDLIELAESTGADCIVTGFTDTNGFFMLDGLELVNNQENEIFIICAFEAGDYPEYVYRYRKVISRYFGALISQTSFTQTHNGSIWYNTTPSYFKPGGSITGSVDVIGGQVENVIPCYSYYRNGLFMDVAYYGYCFNLKENEEYVEEWLQVGPTGYVWIDLQNLQISYLFAFSIVEAVLTPRNKGDDKEPEYGVRACNENTDNVGDIQINLIPVETSRKEIPPGAVLFKYEKNGVIQPKLLSNKDWDLRVKYRYLKLETTPGDSVYWPSFTDGGMVRFKQSPYDVLFDPGGNEFIIPSIGAYSGEATASVMALVVDQEGRLQAVAASKLVLMGHRLTCRSVDISYAYEAPATAFNLEPSGGFYTWRGSPSAQPSTKTGLFHHRNASCGDHGCNAGNCIGPVWFPFNDCTTIDFYNVHNGAAQCTMPISEGSESIKVMGRAAWRYCMADEYNAWVTPGGNWAAACGSPFTFHYSMIDVGEMQFSGVAKKKGKVDEFYYRFMQWALPPFGNTGRASVERWLFRDFASFYDLSTRQPIPRSEYMPLVLDREDLIDDLDAFRFPGLSSHPNLSEPFSHRSALSNITANWIGEQYDPESRYRFEDIIEPEYNGNCMYPWPTLYGFGGTNRVARYKFKDNNLAWAWPEYWKSLERGLDESTYFRFLKLYKPEYFFDPEKNRHRLITDEGFHEILFRPPSSDSQTDEDSPDTPSNLASISIDGVHWRYFKLDYESYTSGYVDWADESALGEDGGSGGQGSEGGINIYEAANNGQSENGPTGTNDIQWIHDFDTLFDISASADPSEDRKAFLGNNLITGEDIYGYYNRGLIAKLPKNRLNQLPMKDVDITGEFVPISGEFSFDVPLGNLLVLAWYYPEEGSPTPTKLIINGTWGTTGNLSDDTLANLCKPSILFRETRDGEIVNVYSQQGRSGEILSPLGDRSSSYTISINFNKYPNRILFPPSYCDLTLTPVENEYMNISSIELYGSVYTEAQESILVWEQKFKVSTLNIGDKANADGPDSKNYRSYDRNGKNAGQYFPYEDPSLWNDGSVGQAASKMVMVSAGKLYDVGEDETIEVSLSSLKAVERDAQKELYEEALALDNYDEVNFSAILPPDVEYFLTDVIATKLFRPAGGTIKNPKVDWEHNEYSYSLTQEGDFFSPGGHYFKWSDQYYKTRCYIFGPVQTVYSTDWVHHRHGGTVQTAHTSDSYAGFVSLAYLEGRFWALKSLGQSETGQPTDALTGAKTNVYTKS